MSLNFAKVALIAVVSLLLQVPCLAQGWERTFGFAEWDGLNDVLTTPDGGYVTVGTTKEIGGINRDIFLVKTDADGAEEWSEIFGNPMYWEFARSIQPANGGGYIIGGTTIADGINYGFIAKTDPFGNQLWLTLSSQDSVQGRRVVPLSAGGYALVGLKQDPAAPGGGTAPNHEAFLMKVDENGSESWWKSYGGSGFDEGYGLLETPDGGLLVSGLTNSFGAGGYDVYLLKTNASGDTLWTKTLGTPAAELSYDLAPCTDGNYVICGEKEETTPATQDAFLAKIDPDGNQIWWRNFALGGIETIRSVQQITSGGNFVLTGDVQANTTAQRQLLLIKTYPEGYLQWQKEFGGVLGDGGNAIKTAPNSGFVIAGFTSSFGAGSSDGYLLRTDATGISLSNFIRGNVHSNLNNTCIPDAFGQYIPNYLVEIAGSKTYYGTTDADGNYFVPVEEGDYNIRLLNPSPIWIACEDSIDVTVTGVFDTVAVDFSIYTAVQCPAMEVDLTTLGLRRCFQNTYTVNYRNLGSVPASPTQVEVTFDPWLTVDSASIPWVSNTGNTYVFDVGTVLPFAGGNFKAWVTVDCDSTLLGQTHCSEAHILPDTLCFDPDPNWDGASVEVEADCVGDSVIFTVRNMGGGDMSEPLELIVIEDVYMGFQTTFQLESFDEISYAFLGDGSMLRLEADQSPGHPGNSQPCIAVEGCGATPFSTGFVVDYPLNDADLFVDMDCRENTGSFDPNDKQAFPTGYGNLHFIEPGTDIEYLIRFQNTGTDTAFTVTIRDTLSQFLDATSIEPGASSHPYRYELYGTGILKFTFDDILLPDSNVNEPLSQGFVKFRIRQQPGNNLGTIIKNSAAIYFDYNAPVITNTVFHTLGENFILIDSVSSVGPDNMPTPHVKVYPNPFDESALFELENIQAQHLAFTLFDATGRQVRQVFFEKHKFQFQRGDLASGLYFFTISSAGEPLASGRIVLR